MSFFSATIDGKLHIGTPYRAKHFWTHQIPTSSLPTLLIFIHIEHICSFFVAFFSATIYMFNVYKNQQSRQTGSRNLMHPKTLPTIWGTYMKLVTKYQISAINSCHIFLTNYWWQRSDIWSQASYMYPILWEAFLDPSDSYFLREYILGLSITNNKMNCDPYDTPALR
jgi:hypothetical protein